MRHCAQHDHNITIGSTVDELASRSFEGVAMSTLTFSEPSRLRVIRELSLARFVGNGGAGAFSDCSWWVEIRFERGSRLRRTEPYAFMPRDTHRGRSQFARLWHANVPIPWHIHSICGTNKMCSWGIADMQLMFIRTRFCTRQPPETGARLQRSFASLLAKGSIANFATGVVHELVALVALVAVRVVRMSPSRLF
jgi:hypothetical protein